MHVVVEKGGDRTTMKKRRYGVIVSSLALSEAVKNTVSGSALCVIAIQPGAE
jgi:hypothetical protein